MPSWRGAQFKTKSIGTTLPFTLYKFFTFTVPNLLSVGLLLKNTPNSIAFSLGFAI
jgi:hypothetical protein